MDRAKRPTHSWVNLQDKRRTVNVTPVGWVPTHHRKGQRMTNHLYYGDNLLVLRDSIGAESVDLIYLDPPVQLQRRL
jgi:16S rRNA G966 N2-methylase RsmD